MLKSRHLKSWNFTEIKVFGQNQGQLSRFLVKTHQEGPERFLLWTVKKFTYICKASMSWFSEAESDAGKSSWSLSDFVIGPVIAKGCSAVVHAARLTAGMAISAIFTIYSFR